MKLKEEKLKGFLRKTEKMEILSKFMNLIHKKKKSTGDMKNLVLMVRNHELNMPDITVEYAIELIKKNKRSLGSECKKKLGSFFQKPIRLYLFGGIVFRGSRLSNLHDFRCFFL